VEPIAPANEEAALDTMLERVKPSTAQRDYWRPHLIVLAAGRAAERKFGVPARLADQNSAGDSEIIEEVAARVCNSVDEAMEYIREVNDVATRIVDKFWPEIREIAKELRVRGEIDEATIRATIASVSLPAEIPVTHRTDGYLGVSKAQRQAEWNRAAAEYWKRENVRQYR
jgi:hypothetical protein